MSGVLASSPKDRVIKGIYFIIIFMTTK